MTIEIRLASPEDAESIQAIYAPVVLNTAISFEEVPPSVEEMRMRILSTMRSYPYLVAVRDGVVLGYAYASQHRARAAYRWAVDVTVYIAQDARRQGVGRALYDVLLPILRRLEYRSAYAGIALPNEGSVGLHQHLGFSCIGVFPKVGYKHGAWHDVGYWHLELNDHSPSPAEPRHLSAPPF
ncbi:GNAT family N-acetyltransferase [Pseudomonas aeruginosa]|uniref:arsinothricin resistance N-acetyltransferase ArsN1 family B n=1 Tax=Pseudomonas aeruginosa TaxID=287 RepID=UPI0009989D8F|nr:arsinothricin resistance N-acetyltransferase ArsN1 family B [Pseudomonas aeruginosa]ELK3486138.1 N-acetyltransferase [Pseudomonas aeruginosa]ELK3488812.1 N-acetyltransferase [Pseudomonas aeruginosa]EME9750193.1 N-acetyltransferase [Pseudomonas aeruginosa]MBG4583258.1 N-acetyltransferase [Pseudomonas aeruginosa]MBH9070824.1 N-acetyltransferase [Pseudomonas aeruginosa]